MNITYKIPSSIEICFDASCTIIIFNFTIYYHIAELLYLVHVSDDYRTTLLDMPFLLGD